MPFLFELRTFLDWTITSTSLDIYAWFKLEDAYFNLFDVKCDMENRALRPQSIPSRDKLTIGCLSFLALMGILLLPMFIFSSFNPSLVENKVLSGTFDIQIIAIQQGITDFRVKLFESTSLTIKETAQNEYSKINVDFSLEKEGVEQRQVRKVSMPSFSVNNLLLSSPTIKRTRELLKNNLYEVAVELGWSFDREYPVNFKRMQGSLITLLNDQQRATMSDIFNKYGELTEGKSVGIKIEGGSLTRCIF